MPSLKKSLKVVVVSTRPDWRGGEEQARLLLLGLRKHGHHCVALALSGSEFEHHLSEAGIETHSFAGHPNSIRSIWTIRKILAREQPDVLHFNDSHAVTSAGIASLGLRIPARIAARRVTFQLRSARKYRMFCDRIICVSQAVADVCRNGGIPIDRLNVVHDSADFESVASVSREEARQILSIPQDRQLLLCAASFTLEKGHQHLLDAIRQLADRFPNIHLALAGSGPLENELRHQADRHGISDLISFLGFREDLPILLRAADLFVLPINS